MALTVDTDVGASEDLFGKVIGDLQSNVTVGENGIDGTLKYISDYSAAGYAGDEAAGHYLVLHAEVPDVDDVTITAEVIGGAHGPVTLDPDGILISYIANNQKKIKITASKTGQKSVTKIYTLNGLTLA